MFEEGMMDYSCSFMFSLTTTTTTTNFIRTTSSLQGNYKIETNQNVSHWTPKITVKTNIVRCPFNIIYTYIYSKQNKHYNSIKIKFNKNRKKNKRWYIDVTSKN